MSMEAGAPFTRGGLVFLSCYSIVLLVQLSGPNVFGPVSNFFVPDGMTMTSTFSNYWSGALDAESIRGGMALNYIYLPALSLGVFGFAILNLAMMALAARCLPYPGGMWEACLMVPYFLLAITLPSKDIAVVLLSTAMVALAVREWTMPAFLMAILVYFIRDGAAVIFLVFMSLWLVVKRRPSMAPFLVATMLAGGILMNLLAERLIGDLFIYARNLQVQQDAGGLAEVAGSGIPGAIVRMFGNITNLAFRPALLDEDGRVAIIGLAYFVSGISVLCSFTYATRWVFGSASRLQLASALFLFSSLAVVSISPLVQPRYLLPATLVVLAVRDRSHQGRVHWKIWAGAVTFSALAVAAYIILPIGLPSPAVTEYWRPYVSP